jgi:hypothetical protein
LDLLPNSSLTPLTWLIAGALIARNPKSGARRLLKKPEGERLGRSSEFQKSYTQ